MNKVVKIAVWLVLIIWGINQSFNMISQANTVENVVGFFLLVAIVLVSYKTRCFTTIKFTRKRERQVCKEAVDSLYGDGKCNCVLIM